MTGELTAHLNRVDQETREQVETLVKQIEEKQGVTEQLKMQDLMKWVEHTLTTSISRIRSKIEADGDTYIKTVYGLFQGIGRCDHNFISF